MDIHSVCKKLQFDGPVLRYEVLSGGNINATYRVTCDGKNEEVDYLLQRINKNVFKNPKGIMDNIINVTDYISSKNQKTELSTLHFSRCKNGNAYVVDDSGDFWRAREFLDCVCFDTTDDLNIIEEAGGAFGEFQFLLDGFDAATLFESIPDFHNTVKRFENLEKSILNCLGDRKDECSSEIRFLLERKNDAAKLINMLNDGSLPLRVTHNDTKCNNVVFNKSTLKALAVIDLDTIMSGLSAYDFGDGARSICCSTLEDETDLTKVFFDLQRFDAFARGYLGRLHSILTENEISSLVDGVYVMTLELAARFLEDYLNGDVYFKTKNKKHNLVRARCQIALCKDILNKYEKIKEVVFKYSK